MLFSGAAWSTVSTRCIDAMLGAANATFRQTYPSSVTPGIALVSESGDGATRLVGRLTRIDSVGGTVACESGDWRVVAREAAWADLRVGDIVALRGRGPTAEFAVEEIQLLTPTHRPAPSGSMTWEQAESTARGRRDRLSLRSDTMRAIRGFLEAAGFLEVQTPALVSAPGLEAHIEPMAVVSGPDDGGESTQFLITSPEHHMKRLLGGGFSRIYQMGKCYRRGEVSPQHQPEFTLVEWYRAYATYREIATDTENLVAHVSQQVLGTTMVEHAGRLLDLRPPWQRLTVTEAFARYGGVDLPACGDSEVFGRQARAAGCDSVVDGDTWEEVFFKVLLDRVEPRLADLGAVLLQDYPAPLASLSKLKMDDPLTAERVEAYIGGMELANGFTELNDPREQRRRFMAERQRRRGSPAAALPLDEAFLRMLSDGMPPAAGMALGVGRLIMMLTDATAIDTVVAFPNNPGRVE